MPRGVVTIGFVAAGGLLIWALHFTLIYAFNTLACTRTFSQKEFGGTPIVPLVVGVATLVSIFVMIGVLFWVSRNRLDDDEDTEHFLKVSTSAVVLLSIIAVFWNAVPAFIVPVCG